MPHSTTLDSQRTARSMNSNSPFSSSSTNRLVGGGAGGGGTGTGSSLDNKWRRASLPVSDMFSDINGNRARSGSIVSTASSARPHARRPQHTELHHGAGQTRDRVLRDAPLIAELRTNVIIKDEYTLVTDLSYHLAARYSKPDSSIMINIDHSSCLALAGTFDPCYILTLTTLPSSLGAESNKRNASLIQAFMADILSVPPDRGIIRFNVMVEENYAINGNTVYGELERVDTVAGATDAIRRGGADQRKSMINLKKSDLDLQKTNGATSDREQQQHQQRSARRKSTLNETASEVFELAAGTDAKMSPGRSSNADAGSRMKASSRENIKGEAQRHRPKTVAATPNGAISADTFAEERSQAKPKHISTVIRAEQKSAHMPVSAKPKSRPLSTVLNRQHSSGTKSLTSITPTPVTLKETIVDNPKVLKADPKYDSDSASNTKRRSTISATPKLPPPPPVPESKTPKVSKRKSFLSAFRR